MRAKNTGPKVKNECIIRGELEKQTVKQYVACFTDQQKTGKLLKRLTADKHGQIRGTGNNVGRNTSANFSKRIATWLQLPEPNLYTGHSFRRTATTFSADASLVSLNTPIKT